MPATAQILVNGSFEAQAINFNVGGGADSVNLPGWTVFTSGPITNVVATTAGSSGVTPTDGSLLLELNGGNMPAGILTLQQTFATTPGFTYGFTVDVGRIGFSGGSVGAAAGFFDAATGTLLGSGSLSDSSLSTPGFFGTLSVSFLATGNSTTLQLTDVSQTTIGVDLALDNALVTVQAVPEPATDVLLVLGATGLVVVGRRRTEARGKA